MPIYPFRKMLDTALENNFAVGYFQAWNEDTLEAVVEAGEEELSPLIIGFGGTPVNQQWFNMWGLEFGAALGRVAVQKARIPVSFILNETEAYDQCIRGLDLGFNAVMIDSSALPYEKNLELNRKLVREAHARGVAVEAELGHLPTGRFPTGKDRSAVALTDPEQAKEFVFETGVDALSVSIGNVHILTEGEARIDLNLLEKIRDKAAAPLVIHGGTGFPPELVKQAIRRGVAKFNVGTILKKVYCEGVREALEHTDEKADIQRAVGSRENEDFTVTGKKRVKEKVRELIGLYGSEGKAHLFK